MKWKSKALLFFYTATVCNEDHFIQSRVTSHALTMSSTPFTLVGCMILILWAFFEETQCSSPSSSNNWICPVSENFTVAPIGTSNSPPVVWSSQTWSPYRGERRADSWADMVYTDDSSLVFRLHWARHQDWDCSHQKYPYNTELVDISQETADCTDANITLCTQSHRRKFSSLRGRGSGLFWVRTWPILRTATHLSQDRHLSSSAKCSHSVESSIV